MCYKLLKIGLAIGLVVSIAYIVVFETISVLECGGEWQANSAAKEEAIVLRNGLGSCVWRVGLSWIFSDEPIFTWETIYNGNWKNNKKHGHGTLTSFSGTKYVGDWKNDKRSGKGTFYLHDNSRISGTWLNDNITCTNGELVFNFKANYDVLSTNNGEKSEMLLKPLSLISYYGSIHDALAHGNGKLVFSNGVWITARFHHGKIISTGGRIGFGDSLIVSTNNINNANENNENADTDDTNNNNNNNNNNNDNFENKSNINVDGTDKIISTTDGVSAKRNKAIKNENNNDNNNNNELHAYIESWETDLFVSIVKSKLVIVMCTGRRYSYDFMQWKQLPNALVTTTNDAGYPCPELATLITQYEELQILKQLIDQIEQFENYWLNVQHTITSLPYDFGNEQLEMQAKLDEIQSQQADSYFSSTTTNTKTTSKNNKATKKKPRKAEL